MSRTTMPFGVAIDEHEIEHLRARKHLHRARRDLPAERLNRRRAEAAARSGRARKKCAKPARRRSERFASSPPYSRANGTPCATHWSMMFDADFREPIDVGFARAEIAAFDRVVKEAVNGVAVVLIIFRGIDAALRGDASARAAG